MLALHIILLVRLVGVGVVAVVAVAVIGVVAAAAGVVASELTTSSDTSSGGLL
jgi:hypothetical protein